jgi:hypothetical protein
VTAAWHVFMIFMFFNATVVFENGLLRWLGLFLCAGLSILWWFCGKTVKAPDSTPADLQETETSN